MTTFQEIQDKNLTHNDDIEPPIPNVLNSPQKKVKNII